MALICLKSWLRHFGKNVAGRHIKASCTDRVGRVRPDWLGMLGQDRRSWPRTAAEFNLSHIYGCLLFLERRVESSLFFW